MANIDTRKTLAMAGGRLRRLRRRLVVLGLIGLAAFLGYQKGKEAGLVLTIYRYVESYYPEGIEIINAVRRLPGAANAIERLRPCDRQPSLLQVVAPEKRGTVKIRQNAPRERGVQADEEEPSPFRNQ